MRSVFKLITLSLFGMGLTFCSSAPKEDSSADALPKFDDYQPAAFFEDDSEAPRETSSNPYRDDEYGDSLSSTPKDDVYGSSYESSEDSSSDSYDDSYDSGSSDPLPLDKLSAPKSSTLQASQFKDGMYDISSNCNMRAEPSQTAAKEGLVPKGKRLWVEGHNDTWVKVFKKSGPVFIHKSCL